MNFKKFAALICSTLLALSSVTMLTVSAQTKTYTIDNDALSSTGFYNYNSGFTYHSFSGSYNGDARRAPTNSGAFYAWCHPQTSFHSQNVTYTLRVYLNHSTFNDPAAKYHANVDGTISDTALFTINQAVAPVGFSSARTTNYRANLIQQIRLYPSEKPNYNTGADAIEITYTYTPNN
ncbi:MAG: hypothetical protein K2I93_08190 [Oscillospiraceae bacterium]|nr:hypothetical protein [Oscillospiraceae bacterium]